MKLVLGTAQLGSDYGINNASGQPSRSESLAILDKAWEGGIRIFDTAHAYGQAEEILGEFALSRNLGDQIFIISKFKPQRAGVIEDEIKKSLGKLKVKRLNGFLLHNPKDVYNQEKMEELLSCKNSGLVENIGVSIYNEEDAIYAASSDLVDYIQIPYSVFDQRLNKTDFFRIAKDNQVTVFARSVFLQGLILMKDEDIPDWLKPARQYLKEFDEIIQRYNLTREQAALLFVYSNPDIDYVVFGADNMEQLDENIKVIKEAKNCDECWAEFRKKFINIEKNIVSPNQWPL